MLLLKESHPSVFPLFFPTYSMRISIRYKVLGVLAFLVTFAVASYTFLASSIFRQEKTALLFDVNHSVASNTASYLRASLLQTANQTRLYALTGLLGKNNGPKLDAQFLKNAGIVSVTLYRKQGNAYTNISTIDSSVPQNQLYRSFAELDQFENSFWSLAGKANSYRYFLTVRIDVQEAFTKTVYAAVAEMEEKTVLDPLREASLFGSYIARPTGEVIVRMDRGKWLPPEALVNHPLLNKVREQNSATSGVMGYEYGGGQWFGAYAKVGVGNFYFISEASRNEVNSAIQVLLFRSLMFGGIVITLSFLVSILFSGRLTRNLNVLMQATETIQEGDLTTKISIRSGDEVEALAKSFNEMIVALKASRDKIEEYNRELEAKVELRTKQLQETNAAIKEVQEKLVMASQLAAVGEVAGRTAHEVLNPLTAIIGRLERTRSDLSSNAGAALTQQFSEILSAWEADYKKGGFEELQKNLATPSSIKAGATLFEEDISNLKQLLSMWGDQVNQLGGHLGFVEEEAHRIHRTIDGMRQLSRSSSNREEINCHQALESAVNLITDFAKKQNITLKKEFAATEDTVIVNRDEFVQVISNLLRNAYQAILSHKDETLRKGSITVKTLNEDGALFVDIIDTGTGIPKEIAEVIFEQGFTTKSPEEGTGLGLAICRRYARAFGGDVILLASDPVKHFSHFRVLVPLSQAALKKAA